MADEGLATGPLLDWVGLPRDLADRPMMLIPYDAAVRIMTSLAWVGPDVGCRIAAHTRFDRMGIVTEILSEGRTVGEALLTLSHFYGAHASHETFRAEPVAGGIEIRSFVNMRLPPLEQHLRQQYTIALILNFAGAGPQDGCAIQLTPHPTAGVAHLVARFGPGVSARTSREFRVLIPAALCARPSRLAGLEAPRSAASPLHLAGLSGSTAVLLRGLLGHGRLNLERLSLLTGRSKRTLQRQFAKEGTSFSDILDSVRRERALSLLASGHRLQAIASEVDYASVSVLCHALRRWAGQPRASRSLAG